MYLAMNPEFLSANKRISMQAAAELGEIPAVMARALTIAPPAPMAEDPNDIASIASVFNHDEELVAAFSTDAKNRKSADIVNCFIKPSYRKFRMQVADHMMESPLHKDTMDALVQLYQMSIK